MEGGGRPANGVASNDHSVLTDGGSLDDIDCLDYSQLIQGHVDLDLGTLHQTLAEPLWRRHECRPQTQQYKPSKGFKRYESSLRALKPVRKHETKSEALAPVERAGLFSILSYAWVTALLKKSHKSGLQPEDVPLIPVEDSCDHAAQRFEHMWRDEVLRHGAADASLKRAVWRFTRTRLSIHIGLYLISLVFGFLGPIVFMRQVLEFCQSGDAPWWQGALWAVGLAGCELLRAIIFASAWGFSYRTAIRLRSAIMTAVYKKIMRLSSLGDKSIGELINLFANDSTRIYEVINMGPLLCGGPFVAIVSTVYTVWILGPHAIVGMIIFLLFYPVQYGISRLMTRFRGRAVAVTDQRVRLMNELLTCVKLIKMYAWEKPFSKTLTDIRAKEKFYLEMASYVQSISCALTPVVPIMAVIVTFLTHIGLGYDLSPAQGFAVVAVMVARVRPSLNAAREALKTWDEAAVVWPRIKSVLCMEEVKPYCKKPLDKNVAIAISDATFRWNCVPKSSVSTPEDRTNGSVPNNSSDNNQEKDKLLVKDQEKDAGLFDIDVLVKRGRLVGVCGSVGSGKSSLLSAILGQMHLVKGRVSIDGSFAYVSQQAWIMNSTLRENITFGGEFDDHLYRRVIACCALDQDLAVLPAGDMTEIGERGINLSGGQRQRVALARALYARKEIYLLDDPLSAVDGHVGQHIFDKCIRGILKGKTIVFVTHQLQFLGQCDDVVFMDSGKIVAQGHHSELMQHNDQYSFLINTFLRDKREESADSTLSFTLEGDESQGETGVIGDSELSSGKTSRNASIVSNEANKISPAVHIKEAGKGRLTETEKLEVGAIPLKTYTTYIKYAGGYLFTVFVLLIFVINVSSTALSSWWLAHWLSVGVANATREVGNETEIYLSVRTHPDLAFYETIYGSFILVIIVSSLLRSFLFIKATHRAASLLHNKLFSKIFACPMRFFDSTPVGRILNMFSRDLDEIDCRLPTSTEVLLQNIIIVAISIVFIVYAIPWFVIALAILAIAFAMFTRVFRGALRDLKRLENVSRSPIYSHVAATVTGLSTVHAFRKEREFISKFMILFDESASTFYLFHAGMRWIAVRLDFIAVCALGTTAGLVVALRGVIPAAFAGLALAYSNQLSGITQHAVRLASEAEARFTSVQRMHNYLLGLECEGPSVNKDRRPPKDWPQYGAIRFVNVKMGYRPNLPLALHGVTFDIKYREKIGIVGRTGSGKSSLGSCLFRLVELNGGVIKIDDINIAEIGLEDLRSKLAIIPQDPVLFIGTIRYNLDPFEKYTDVAIWEALERTNMKDKIKCLPNQLEHLVIENGENFSVGERQLLCMARALLRHSKILLMDEATAAIDSQTDALVHHTVRDAFKDCTILTIAHRLNTVVQCDRILVLEAGKVVEFDKPSVLLANRDSLFSSMMAVAETPQ